MSSVVLEKVKCPSCENEFEIKKYNSVNVTLDSELKDKLLSGELTSARCTCGQNITLRYPLLYHKMGLKSIMLQYTETDVKTAKAQYQAMKSDFYSLFASTPLQAAMKKALEKEGKDMSDVFEVYNDWDKFIERVKEIG